MQGMDESQNQEAKPPKQNDAEKDHSGKPSFWKRLPVVVVGTIAIAALLIWGGGKFANSFSHQGTDDAFLAAKRRPDCTNPVPIHSASPKYPPAAMQAKLQGDVALDVIVLADGSIGKVRVTSSLDRHFGLDREAVIAARQWKFKPGMKGGQAVNVRATIEVNFRLL